MASNKEIPLKKGFLLVQVSPSKKKWPKKFCLLFNFTAQGVHRLELYDGEDDVSRHVPWKVIKFEDCDRISEEPQKNQPHAFSIVTKCATHLLAGSTSEETREWMSACQGVAFRDSFSSATIEEDNELYCPSGDAGVYRVVLVKSEVTQRCGLPPGEYTLVVASEELQLQSLFSQKTLFTWPYRFIRRYSYKRGRFSFEAGRKCASGEGLFDLEHSNSKDIFSCMSSKMNSMKMKLSGAVSSGSLNLLDSQVSSSSLMDFSSPSSIEVDEGLAAAKSMSARSRSPLVSITSSISTVTPSPSLPPPAKPPRKNPPPPRYDEVEVRPDPPRLFGDFSPAVFPRPPPTLVDLTYSDYDKLDHFGSTPKIDEDPSYSTIFRQDTTGYGVIRKVTSPRHQVYNNNIEYALVFKSSHKV